MGTILAAHYNEGMARGIMQKARDGGKGALMAIGTIIKIRTKTQIDNAMRARESRSTERVRSEEGSSQGEELVDQMKRILDQMQERENKLKQEAEQRLQRELARVRREEQEKLQQERDRFQRQLGDVQTERDQARNELRGDRDRFQRQLGDAREERDQARNELREAGRERDLARTERDQALEERDQAQRQLREMERARNQVQARERSAVDRRNETMESTFRKLRFMNNLENNIEEILRESPPEADCLRRVRDLYRNTMNAALNIELTREQFAQDFRNCVEQMAEDWNVPDDVHLKFSNNVETITKIVKNLDGIFQRYDHEDVLLIQVRELYTSTLREFCN